MASEASHLKKAEHHQAFLDTIPDAYADWLTVVAFYKAVHLVEAMFARAKVHSTSHNERNRRLQTQHADIWMEFRPLFDNSRLVRYTEKGIPARHVRVELIGKRLVQVEALVKAKLAIALPGAAVATPAKKP